MTTYANLDENGLLLGFEVNASRAYPLENQVAVLDNCDLAPGRYIWDRKLKSFWPLPPALVEGGPGADALHVHALALGLVALSDQGSEHGLPSETMTWALDHLTYWNQAENPKLRADALRAAIRYLGLKNGSEKKS